MKKLNHGVRPLLAVALIAVAFGSSAQTQSNNIGDGGGSIDQQIIGDTSASADHTQSTSTQLGNSANNNGASMANNVDTRDQNTVTSTGGQATGGTAIGNQSDNKSSASASNGAQTMGQANTGNSTIGDTKATVGNTSSSSGGNILSAEGGKGGTGGTSTSSSNGTNAQGQQQGIKDSGNSAVKDSGNSTNTVKGGDQSNTSKNTNTAAQGQGQGQQQSNTGTNAQGQSSTNTAGGNSGGNSTNRQSTSAGNGAGAGAGSGNKTSNSTVVEGDTTNNRTQVWANPVIHGAPAAAVPSANLIMKPGVCGPRIRVVSTQVTGIRFGFFGGQTEVPLGYTDKVGPYLNEDGTPGDLFIVDKTTGYLIGNQYDTYGSTLSVSTANSFSLGAFHNGDAGQGGAASSGGMQTIGLKIVIAPCVMPVKRLEAMPAQAAPVLPVVPAPGQ